jgi:predicted amidohydrolase YtcJ
MNTRILTNCKVYTFNPRQPIVEALAIQDGRILAAGSRADIAALSDSSTIIEDLGGQVILPALTDAHIHLLEYGFSLMRVNCETITRAECLQRVRERVSQTQSGQWVLGHGWNHNIWPESSGDKAMLDAFSPEHPVYLTHKSLHSGWANSAALQLAGIHQDSPDPQGGVFQRDQNGQLTGILLESAMRVVESVIPHPDQPTRIEALSQAQQSLLAYGITSVHDFDPWDAYTALAAMQNSRQLTLRVIKGIPLPNLDEAIAAGLKSGQGSSHLRIGWLKLFADGALGPQTAAMLAPYQGSTSTGMLFIEGEDIVKVGRKALPHGISLAVHAIGDRANHEIINGYAQLDEMGLLKEAALPARIEHVQLIDPQDIPRLAAHGITASMQPIHAISDRHMADRYWGERSQYAYAWQSVAAGGSQLIFGSDAPVESPNPYWGIFAAATRKPLNPQEKLDSWYPQQCLPIADALAAYITQPQAAAGQADQLGLIQRGAIADLVSFTTDPFATPAENFAKILPQATMVDGEWVFTRT